MEKYENIMKIEEIRRLAEDNQYIKAIKILDTIDINKIKPLTDLSIVADVFTQNERYDDAMKVLTKIYAKTKTRRILYQLVDLSIKCRNVHEAEEYLEWYIKAAPQDSYRFIFRCCIDRIKGESYQVLIDSLEQLKEYEYIEMWAYELAKLYHKAGMKDKCVRECSDIVLWFGNGIFVEKAKLLKAYYVGEINPIQMLKAKEKKEAENKLELDKTKDYSSMRSEIDRYLAEDEANKNIKEEEEEVKEEDTKSKENTKTVTYDEELILSEENQEHSSVEQRFIAEGLDYEKSFGYFIHNNSCRKQIETCLENILYDNTKTIQMIIAGESKTGKTTLAKKLSKALYRFNLIKTTRVAKITATKLNSINILQKSDNLMDCSLIIEEAGLLDSNKVEQLLQLMRDLNGHIIVCLEDNELRIKTLLEMNPKLAGIFKNQINLPLYNRLDLLGFANNYIEECDYQLSENAKVSLLNYIDEAENNSEERNHFAAVITLTQRAKVAADQRNKRILSRVNGIRDLDSKEFLFIKEEDFQQLGGV